MPSKFDLITIKCVTPEKVLDWAERVLPNGEIIGEITKPETIHYKTLKPKLGGLFCQQIFGTIKAGTCECKLPMPRIIRNKTSRNFERNEFETLLAPRSSELVYKSIEKQKEKNLNLKKKKLRPMYQFILQI